MKPLFTEQEFKISTYSSKLPLQCYRCGNTFYQTKGYINRVLNPKAKQTGMYCSKICQTNGQLKQIQVNCKNCNTTISVKQSKIPKSKNNFCSQSCAASYNNKHKSHGTRRSKLELWIEQQLTQLYPNLHIDYNKTSAINAELDIYIPSLNIAFELNGIVHYEPIYGVDKLQKIQENDISKSKACHDTRIDLCIIDTTGLKYFKPCNAQKYLDIITNIINQRTKGD
jgi:hypothetical protein